VNCPHQIADCLLDIITIGLLNIRSAADQNQTQRCYSEADHIHNVPSLLKSFSYDLLKFYLTVERQSYSDQTPEQHRRIFEPAWRDLEKFAETSN
jgi:hypothetical protein